jgi:phospholipase/carboxylesterase
VTALDYSNRVIDGWTVRLRPGPGAPAAVLLALHGLTGDERSLDIFTSRIPANTFVLSPRAPLAASPGFSWLARTVTTPHPQASEFGPIVGELERRIPAWLAQLGISATLPIQLMGFSQGAALCLRLVFSTPRRYLKIAVLSGFLPEGEGSESLLPDLSGVNFFIAHGTQDETVPVAEARRMAARLDQARASVIYCEDAVGHKLGPSCFRGLTEFFSAPLG